MVETKDVVALAISVLTLMGLISGGIAWGFKYVALPWFKQNLVEPVKEVNKQVSVNSFVSKEPTMLDRIHTISDKVHDVEEQVDGVETKVNTANTTLNVLSDVWEHQMEYTNDEFRKVWAAIHSKHQQSYDEGRSDER